MTHIIGKGRYARETYQRPPLPSSALPLSPLTSQFWVDSDTTVPLADRNGSIERPFGSVQAAYDAAVAIPLDSVIIIVAKSDPTEDIVLTSTIVCSIVSLAGPLSPNFAALSDFQATLNSVTVTGALVALQGLKILTDLTVNIGGAIVLRDCLHLGNIDAAPGSIIADTSSLCAAGGTVNVDAIQLLDETTERTLFTSSLQAWLNLSALVISNAGGPNFANVLGDADDSLQFTGESRRILPAKTITAPRTITLTVGGAGDFATGYIDIYEQDFNVIIEDSVGPTTLATYVAGESPRRYGFQLPDATSWINFRSEKLG